MKDCAVAFGAMMIRARERKGYSQREAAERLGITQSYYSKLENGVLRIDLDMAVKICEMLSIDIGAFFKDYMSR